MKRAIPCLILLTLALEVLSAAPGAAQTDEIQVYDAEIIDPGQFNLVWHNNFTPDGRKDPEFIGGIAPNHTLNGVPEWAYGVADWLELGAYVPLYSITGGGQFKLDGVKARALFVVPHAGERKFFYGINFELSYNASHWEHTSMSGEIRPIVGAHLGRVDVIVNPILDTSFDGFGQLDFAPAFRVAWNWNKKWAAALEHYSDFGPLSDFAPVDLQQQTLFGVVDWNGGPNGVEFGVGHGFTSASDDWVVKLMLTHDFGRKTHGSEAQTDHRPARLPRAGLNR